MRSSGSEEPLVIVSTAAHDRRTRSKLAATRLQLAFSCLVDFTGLAVTAALCMALADASWAASPSSTPPSAAPAPASSGAAIESQVLAFQGVDRIAAHIASKICAVGSLSNSSTIVIYDQSSFTSLAAFEAFAANIKVMVGAYKTLIPDLPWLRDRLRALAADREAADSVAVAKNAMSMELANKVKNQRERLAFAFAATGDPFSDFTALLSAIAVSANTETPNSITIPDSAIAVALTPLLTQAQPCASNTLSFKVIYPPLFGRGSSSDYSAAEIETDIQVLEDIRQIAHEVVLNALKQYKAGGDQNALLIKAITDIDGLYDSFMNSLLMNNPGTGVIGSAAVIQGYRLATLLKSHSTHTLLATVLAAGGTERDQKTFWTSLGSGDKLKYSGGLIVNVALWQAFDGTPEFSEVLEYKSGFVNADGPVDHY